MDDINILSQPGVICSRIYQLMLKDGPVDIHVKVMAPIAYAAIPGDYECYFEILGLPDDLYICENALGTDSMQSLEGALAGIRSYLRRFEADITLFGNPFNSLEYPTPVMALKRNKGTPIAEPE